MTTVTISLPDSLRVFLEMQVATKGFGNVSEYFRSLLREAQAKEADARLEALLLEGLASERVPLDAAFRRRMEAKLEQIIEKHSLPRA
jgi:antitoxin ParD1/3/4